VTVSASSQGSGDRCELLRFDSPASLAEGAARRWLDAIEAAARSKHPFTVALSGGRIAKDFFQAFVKLAASRADLLRDLHFFWADERCVPPNHADSNFRVAEETLLRPLGILAECVHRLRGEADPAFALDEAEAELCRVAALDDTGFPMLDLVVLGMGEDGHVASLFPGGATGDGARPFMLVTASPKPPPRRLTLTAEAIRRAKAVWCLASGAGKETVLAQSLSPEGTTPLARVIQSRQATTVFTDLAV
jgi:6-phosphogluconolactonase